MYWCKFGKILTTGCCNTLLGYLSGNNLKSGMDNVIIGSKTTPSSNNSNYEIVIGSEAKGHGNNIAVIGNSSCTAWHPQNNITVDLGSSTYQFKDLHMQGDLNVGNVFKYSKHKLDSSISSDKTLTVADSGTTYIITTNNLSFTLPDTSDTGYHYKFILHETSNNSLNFTLKTYTSSNNNIRSEAGDDTTVNGHVSLNILQKIHVI